MSEVFEITDHLGRSTGKKKKREEVHRDGDWHRSSHLHLIHPDHRIIFQKRSDKKDVCSGLIDVAVGGHHSPGEPARNTIQREALEEIGIDINHYPGELIPIRGYRIAAHEFPEKKIFDHEVQDVSFFLSDLRIEQLVLQQEEIFAIMEFYIQDILDLFSDQQKQVRNLSGLTFDQNSRIVSYIKPWSKNDFVATADLYFGKAAFIAQRILQGERNFPGI